MSAPAQTTPAARTWIFQANPSLFRLADALKALTRLRWTVPQFRDEIRAGDRVYLWQSGPNGGLMAGGRILTDPAEMAELPEELAFATEPDANAIEVRVELELAERFDPPVRRDAFLRHPVLANCTLIRAPQGTNFRLSAAEAAAVAEVASPPPTFATVMRRYHRDGVVFLSPERGAVYCVSAVDDSGCEIARLTANEPERCSFAQYDTKLALVRQNGGRFPHANLDATAARRTAYLHGPELGLTADRKEVVVLDTAAAAAGHFETLLAALNVDRSSGQPKLYKPVMMACVLEGVLSGDLSENRIAFDWILPRFLKRMQDLGQDAGPQQAAYAYYNLASEQFWLLCYNDPKQFIPSSSDANAGVIRERVRFAVLKDTYWRTLTDTDLCRSLLSCLAVHWWPDQGSAQADSIPGSPPPVPSMTTSAGTRYWAIGLGEEARLWQQCRQEGIIAIGMDYLGDLQKYTNRDAITAAIRDHDATRERPTNDSLACYQFCREMSPGDVVFVKQGRSRLLGCGVVVSDYEFRPTRAEYHHVRKVRWENYGEWEVPQDARVTTKTLTDVSDGSRYKAFLDFAIPLRTPATPLATQAVRPAYTIDRALDGVFLPRGEFVSIIASLGRKKNAILQGPPGVGKTFLARRLAYHLVGFEDPDKVMMVQFHQSYSYEDFVQGWRPNERGGFDRRDGVFYEFCRTADGDPTSNYVFIIDEINRGNLSKVFGELFTLLEADKRGADYAVPLTYARNKGERFHVPKNLYLLGLMNTADRSLALVDYALRRRFAFVDLRPAYEHPEFRSFLSTTGIDPEVVDCVLDRMRRLNETIRADDTRLGSGYEIGHSFFCPQGTEDSLGMDWYRSVVRTEVAPLLHEYWFDDPAKANKLIAGLLE